MNKYKYKYIVRVYFSNKNQDVFIIKASEEEIDTKTDHALTTPYDGWSYGLRWLAERKDGELVHKSELVGRTEKGIVVGETTYGEMGIDPADVLRKMKRKNKDWKSL